MPLAPTLPAARAPRLLALDTATETLAVAVVHGADEWVANEPGGALASARLLPLAFELLERAGLVLADLDAIAFGHGPGAFTGLRTACSVAQGLAFGACVPVLALDSLALVAEDAFAQQGVGELWVAMDARMNEAYAAAYRREGAAWCVVQSPALWSIEALAKAWRAAPPRVVAGNAIAAFGARLDGGAARRIDAQQDRAAALARLARAAWSAGAGIDAALALPLYLRDKVAQTMAERAARTAAAA